MGDQGHTESGTDGNIQGSILPLLYIYDMGLRMLKTTVLKQADNCR
jgi:hypothetical protein